MRENFLPKQAKGEGQKRFCTIYYNSHDNIIMPKESSQMRYFHTQGIVTNVVNTAVPTRSYGSQRVFSTLGYALLNFLTGVIIDSYHPTGMSSYTACFYVYLPCILGVIPCGILLLGKVPIFCFQF